ncbi:MAG TPA: endolytic transglycosylase MltG [Candidatus Binatia bacterium]|nr:endolytic transglycosylase MltG [Candidatus Binatia bacterium]
MRSVLWVFLLAILAAAAWFAWAVGAPVQPAPQTIVLLHPGYSTHRIAAELKSAGVIRSERGFLLLHYLRRRTLKAGEYLFDQPANSFEIQKRLQRGDVYFHTVVVPEGFTMFDIARAVEAAGLGPASDFIKEAETDTALISDLAPSAPSLEGFLFPDTYQFTRMQTMHDLAAAMVRQFRAVARDVGLIAPTSATLTTVDANSAPGLSSGTRDLERTVIMASIIEKETAAPGERPLVASVYYNRLAKGVALDADPSIIYAELLAGSYSGALHHDDMRFASPYNTYIHAGLPPGPIGNPGKSALEAAMHPAQSDYYYFVADAAGHHRFSRTIEEHNKNVAAYRRAVRGQ